MNKFILAASAAAAAFAMAPTANAAAFDIELAQNGNTFTADYGNMGDLGIAFTDTFTFFPSITDAVGGFTLSHLQLDAMSAITFTAIWLNDIDLMPYLVSFGDGQGIAKANLLLGAGQHVLTISGEAGANASYSGTVNFITSPIPEPTTWAMMIVGLAAVGFTMRRSHTTRVAFS